eukprot:356930-Chlamydomonas_euryale.AAC.6
MQMSLGICLSQHVRVRVRSADCAEGQRIAGTIAAAGDGLRCLDLLLLVADDESESEFQGADP